MILAEKISTEYINNLVADKLRSHSKLLFFKGRDFNNSDSFCSKLAKNISAIANSGGGNIIYGIETKRGKAENFNFVKGFRHSNEWLFHEIQARIDQGIKDLIINILNFDENSSVIHINIPENNGQPHMFSDSKYYKWQKNKSILLEEAEVRSLYGKLSVSELEFLGIYNTNGLPILSAGKFSSMSFYPKILIKNSGNIVEKDYKIEISFPASLFEESFQPLKSLFIRHDGSYVVFGNKGVHPIFQQEIATMIEAKLSVNIDNVDVFLKEFLNINLYFSNGVKKHSLKLCDTLTYNGKVLQKEQFSLKNELKLEI